MKMTHVCRNALLVACAILATGSDALAAVTSSEADKLRTTLTPLGGERAGNADGTIPAWTGGYEGAPPGWKPGEPRPDPYAHEKPLLVIDASNFERYSGKLTNGLIALFRRYPSFEMRVYTTHRSMTAPKSVYDATYGNATHASLENGNLDVVGAFGGVPFPIPKSGAEVQWNSTLRPTRPCIRLDFEGYIVDSNGRKTLANVSYAYQQYPYYYANGSYNELLADYDGDFWFNLVTQTDPPYKSGQLLMWHEPLRYSHGGRQAWQYLTGQRRVRRAPTLSFDLPNPVMSGFNNLDEVLGFFGVGKQYDWSIVGKKEIYVPYNENRLTGISAYDVLGPHFLKPEDIRYELHRVWVVTAALKPDERNVVPKRTLYFDEDSWNIVYADEWDGRGQLWKHVEAFMTNLPEVPLAITDPYVSYNLQTGAYMTDIWWEPRLGANIASVKQQPDSFFTPEGVVAAGVR